MHLHSFFGTRSTELCANHLLTHSFSAACICQSNHLSFTIHFLSGCLLQSTDRDSILQLPVAAGGPQALQMPKCEIGTLHTRRRPEGLFADGAHAAWMLRQGPWIGILGSAGRLSAQGCIPALTTCPAQRCRPVPMISFVGVVHQAILTAFPLIPIDCTGAAL